MRRSAIDTILGKLAVFELGERGPVTLLWPSLYVDHQSLLPIARELANARRCILLDGPGHGASAVPSRTYDLWDCASAAEQVLDSVGAKDVDFIGNAWGGHVGICLAASSARIRTLTVVGSPIVALTPPLRLKSVAGMALLTLGARDLVGKLVAEAMLARAAAPRHRHYVQRCVSDAPAGGIELAIRSISLGRPDLTRELPRISAPTLFIAGSEDALWSPETASSDASAIADARCEGIAGAAHLVPLECPRETLEAVERFYAAHAS